MPTWKRRKPTRVKSLRQLAILDESRGHLNRPALTRDQEVGGSTPSGCTATSASPQLLNGFGSAQTVPRKPCLCGVFLWAAIVCLGSSWLFSWFLGDIGSGSLTTLLLVPSFSDSRRRLFRVGGAPYFKRNRACQHDGYTEPTGIASASPASRTVGLLIGKVDAGPGHHPSTVSKRRPFKRETWQTRVAAKDSDSPSQSSSKGVPCHPPCQITHSGRHPPDVGIV